MLVSINAYHDSIGAVIASINNNSSNNTEVAKGIYEIGHFNFENCIYEKIERYPDVEIGPYGVCDSYEQILEQCPELESSEKKYCISITPIRKSNEESPGGWRWHKWGEYIGTHEITSEYIADEPLIEKVYVYHIYELLS